MQYVEGMTLQARIDQDGRLQLGEVLRVGIETASGLAAAHAQGLVHRDIKPANILLEGPRPGRIADFGLAGFAGQTHPEEPADAQAPRETKTDALTQTGTVLGTPDYIAPEQIENTHAADTRSDVYSLGCVLYYLLAGQVPFPESSILKKLLAHREKAPQPLTELRRDLPTKLVRVVERMMAKDPARRYQTPAEVVRALAPFAAPPPPVWYRRLLVVGAAASIVAVAFVVYRYATDPGRSTAGPRAERTSPQEPPDEMRGKEIRRFPVDTLARGVAFSPDGRQALARALMHRFDRETGRPGVPGRTPTRGRPSPFRDGRLSSPGPLAQSARGLVGDRNRAAATGSNP
jgi:hypothetical protein